MTGNSLTNVNKFKWDENRLRVAELLSEGTQTMEDVATLCSISRTTIHHWKQYPAFIEKIDELTIKAERHTVAGMLREIDKKMDGVGVGKTDWAKLQEMKIKLLGLEKHKVEHSGGIGVCIVDDVPKE